MKITYTCEASPSQTEATLTKRITNLLQRNERPGTHVEFISPVDVREGDENCGRGPLNISGTVRTITNTMPGKHVAEWVIESTGSIWRNYGAPHGTQYDIVIELQKVRPTRGAD